MTEPPRLLGYLDGPGPFSPVEEWESRLAEVRAIPEGSWVPSRESLIAEAEKGLAEAKMTAGKPRLLGLIDPPSPFSPIKELEEWLAWVRTLPDGTIPSRQSLLEEAEWSLAERKKMDAQHGQEGPSKEEGKSDVGQATTRRSITDLEDGLSNN